MFKPSKSFWLSWILATIFSFAIGLPLGGISFTFFDEYHEGHALLGLITIISAVIGLGQWIVLRTRLVRAWIWIPSTAIGGPLGFTIGYWVSRIVLGLSLSYKDQWKDAFLLSSIAGLIIGVLQWLAVARNVKGSFQWIFVSALSWGIGITVLGSIDDFMIAHKIDFGYFNPAIIVIVLGGLVGTITGAFVESTLLKTTHKSIDLPTPAR